MRNTGVVVPCAEFKTSVILLFKKVPYFLSKKSNKDRNNRDENHQEIHLGLQRLKSTHTPNSMSKKKAQALWGT